MIAAGTATQIEAPSPIDLIDHLAGEAIHRWRSHAAEVESVIATLGEALANLGDRKGARVDAAREFVVGELDRLRPPFAAWGSWNETVTSLCEALSAARHAHAVALACYQHAAPADASKLRDALEMAHAKLRQVQRAVDAAVAAVQFPHVPGRCLEAFEQARSDTEALAGKPKVHPMRRMHKALDQATWAQTHRHGRTVALLWVAFETDAALAPVFEARHARYAEGP